MQQAGPHLVTLQVDGVVAFEDEPPAQYLQDMLDDGHIEARVINLLCSHADSVGGGHDWVKVHTSLQGRTPHRLGTGVDHSRFPWWLPWKSSDVFVFGCLVIKPSLLSSLHPLSDAHAAFALVTY